MSLRYKGGVISATPPTTTGGESGTASGNWTLTQQFQAQGAGNWPIPLVPKYIEDVFSTYLYTGNDSTQTITNGIDLAGKGGLIWLKKRNNTSIHGLWDTARGGGSRLSTESTSAAGSVSPPVTFNSNGFTLLGGSSYLNESSTNTYVSWTFRKQPKFFDVVTYTGNGVSGRAISHNLGSVPGCIIVKCTSTSGDDWIVYHLSLGSSKAIFLNLTSASGSYAYWDGTNPTSTTFTVNNSGSINGSGATYVAYLFAHDAGGFGLTGTDNVISCGDFTTNSSGVATVNLGYEPQWLLIKQTTGTRGWFMYDNMRGMFANGGAFELLANSTASEQDYTAYNNIAPTATGFVTGSGTFYSSTNYIYIAIRRGPMKTPTSGTSVFAPVTYTGDGTNTLDITAGFPVDMFLNSLTNVAEERLLKDRLRGGAVTLSVTETTAESTSYTIGFDSNTQILNMPSSFYSQNGVPYVDWLFRRAPGFFDVVCYTGTGSNTTQTHNLSVVPELIIVKRRNTTGAWDTYSAALSNTEYLVVNTTAAKATGATRWNSTTPTSTVFSLGTSTTTNASASTYVAYLFATCPGVSKVGSYTGTGTTLQVNCGFTGGARFVLIKRTDSTGDWYLWDSARGIVAGNDPYIVLNTQSAQVTNTDYIDTYSAGFEISSTAPAAINANGGTFIFLAIA